MFEGLAEKGRQRAAEAAAPHLEPGEQVEDAFIGQTFVSPYLYFLVGPLLFIFMVRGRAPVVTNRHAYVLGGRGFKEVLAKVQIGAADIDLSRFGLKVGDADRVYAMFGQLERMRGFAALAMGEREARAAPS